MFRFLFIPAALTLAGLTLGGCEPSNGQMATFAGPLDQHARQLENDLAAERDKTAQMTKRCELLTDEIAKLRWREEQLNLQIQAIGDAPRQREALQRQVQALQGQIEILRQQVITLGGTPPPREALPPLVPPRTAPAVASMSAATAPRAYAPATAPAATTCPAAAAPPAVRAWATPPTTAPAPRPLPATRPAGPKETPASLAPLSPPEDVPPSPQESR